MNPVRNYSLSKFCANAIKAKKNIISNGVKTVMAFGTFDLLHPGHKYFLRQAKKYGDYLIVVIARDKTVKKVKGKLPQHSEKQRQKAVLGLNLTDKVIFGSLTDKYAAVKKYRPNLIALGYDQTHFVNGLSKGIKIIHLKPFQAYKYKTSIIKNEKRSN